MKSNEAALKYFLMGSFSTGIMLMGIALVYGSTGSFGMTPPPVNPVTGLYHGSFLEVAGLLLLFVSMAFKVSAAPFHFWTPDVYDGAPSVFTSFMATIVKAAGFIAFIRLFAGHTTILGPTWKIILSFVIIATLLIGNITAVFQQSVKRMWRIPVLRRRVSCCLLYTATMIPHRKVSCCIQLLTVLLPSAFLPCSSK